MSPPHPVLSIAIVNYNNKQELELCLHSLSVHEGSADWEIFVWDNDSSDGSADMVAALFPQVHLMRGRKNLGLSRGLNQILPLVRGDFILFLDSDTEVLGQSLNLMLTFLQDHTEVGIVGPRIFNADGSIQETARRFPNIFSGLFGRRALFHRLFPDNVLSRHFMCKDEYQTTQPFEVDYVSAACLLMRREVQEANGFLDENFFVYWTDVDWCRRSSYHGFKIFCFPAAKVIHYERYQPEKRKNPRMIMDFHKGAYRYYLKHHIKWLGSPLIAVSAAVLIIRAGLYLFFNHFKKP